jgi:SAM-dependent methyltransferase
MKSSFDYVGSELELFRDATRWKRYVAAQISAYISGDVLEVGAGLGATTQAIHSPRAAGWTCLEPDAALATQLRSTVSSLRDARGAAPTVQIGTVAELEPRPRFDCILYLDVLEHIVDDRAELRRAAARLRPDGHLIVLSPAWNFLRAPFDVAIGHHRRYDRRSLAASPPPRTRLVLARYLDAAGVAASLANRLLLKQALPTRAQIRFWDAWLVPLSRLVDPALGFHVGKSVLVVWQKA